MGVNAAVAGFRGGLGRRTAVDEDDEYLVARLRAGDDAAFEAIYDRYARGVLAFCAHMLGDREAAEDVLQVTFVSAFRALRASEGDVSLRPWLYTIARNRCLSELRARRDLDVDEAATDRPSPEGVADQVQRREDFREMLDDLQRLPADQRAALVLFELGDHSHAEIAAVLGVRREKIKALVFQAREALTRGRRAREHACADIRERLATTRGGALPRSVARAHIDRCPGCAAFEREIRRQRGALALILPVVLTAELKASVLRSALSGAGPVAAGGATAAGGVGGAGAIAAGASAAGGASLGAGAAGTAVLAGAPSVVAVAGGVTGVGAVGGLGATGLLGKVLAAAAIATAGTGVIHAGHSIRALPVPPAALAPALPHRAPVAVATAPPPSDTAMSPDAAAIGSAGVTTTPAVAPPSVTAAMTIPAAPPTTTTTTAPVASSTTTTTGTTMLPAAALTATTTTTTPAAASPSTAPVATPAAAAPSDSAATAATPTAEAAVSTTAPAVAPAAGTAPTSTPASAAQATTTDDTTAGTPPSPTPSTDSSETSGPAGSSTDTPATAPSTASTDAATSSGLATSSTSDATSGSLTASPTG